MKDCVHTVENHLIEMVVIALSVMRNTTIGKIQTIIKDIKDTTNIAVDSAKYATDAISQQNEAVQNTSKIFKNILEVVDVITSEIQEIKITSHL